MKTLLNRLTLSAAALGLLFALAGCKPPPDQQPAPTPPSGQSSR
ncbi:hypothetical protein [Dokdonella sp.]|nr:hypothetical protein [Dokdonella sp.]